MTTVTTSYPHSSKITSSITRRCSAPDWTHWLTVCLAVVLVACTGPVLEPDAAISCDNCAAWNEPQVPFHVFGNTYYVGTAGLSSILVTTDKGLILIDGGLPQSAPLIEESIRTLGFDVRDIRFIAVSHAHFDHVGGIAALARVSAATVIASPHAVRVLKEGASFRDDPQFGPDLRSFAPVEAPDPSGDDLLIALGGTTLRGIPTPGHTLGGTTWTWRTCEAERCLDVVYADSLSPVSAPGYRFSDGMGDKIRQSAEAIASLECDIFLSPHPIFFGMQEKLQMGKVALIDDGACGRYANSTLAWLARRLEKERPPEP